MPERDKLPGEPLALRIFRRCEAVTVTAPGGELFQGRGIITAQRRESKEAGGKRHPLGVLDRPLYRFLGFLPDAHQAVGGILTQGDMRYTVLDQQPVLLGGQTLGVRALLERREEADELE